MTEEGQAYVIGRIETIGDTTHIKPLDNVQSWKILEKVPQVSPSELWGWYCALLRIGCRFIGHCPGEVAPPTDRSRTKSCDRCDTMWEIRTKLIGTPFDLATMAFTDKE